MSNRTLFALGAFTIAGLAVFGVGRRLDRWRRSNIRFEYPLEDLFV